MKLRDIASRLDQSLAAWQPELGPRLDQLNTVTPMPDGDAVAAARANAPTTQDGAR